MMNQAPTIGLTWLPGSDGPSKLGWIGAAVFIVFFQLNATVAYIGLGLVTLVFMLQIRHWLRAFSREPVIMTFLLAVGYLVTRSIWAIEVSPEELNQPGIILKAWLHALNFIPLAWCIRTDSRGFNRILWLLVAGVMIRIVLHAPEFNLTQIRSGVRTGLGINSIAMGLYSSVAFLGIFTLTPPLAEKPPLGGNRYRLLGLLASVVAGASAWEAFLLSQSRGAWVAAAVSFPFIVALSFRYLGDDHRSQKSQRAVMILLIGCISALTGLQYSNIVGKRLSQETVDVSTMTASSSGGPGISHRLAMWRVGLHVWTQHPFVGWGPGSSSVLLDKADAPEIFDAKTHKHLYSHFHNTYLELLVQFGLVGGLTLGLLGIAILHGVVVAYRQGSLILQHFLFLIGTWGLAAIWSSFDCRLYHYEWRNFCVIVAGLSFSVYLSARSSATERPALK